MPTREAILEVLAQTAHHYAWLAVAWNVALLSGLLFVLLGLRSLHARRLALLAALPALSVVAVALVEGIAVHAVMFGSLWLFNSASALRIDREEPLERGPLWAVALGALTLVYAASYGHFAPEPSALPLLVGRGPVGVLPCPTLAAIAGLGLVSGGFNSPGFSLATGVWALSYGLVGVLWLRVELDLGLVIAALGLLALGLRARSLRRTRALEVSSSGGATTPPAVDAGRDGDGAPSRA